MSLAQSPRSPMSPDVSRRRFPRTKDKRRALRDFYGIQSGLGQDQQTGGDSDGPVGYDADLDAAEFQVSLYLEKIARRPIQELLQLENSLVRDIRILDGERKALVYDNYGRMLAATETLKNVTAELQTVGKDVFDPILTSIGDLMRDLNSVDSEQHQEGSGLSLPDDDDNSSLDNPDDSLRAWKVAGPDRVSALMEHGELDVAQLELDDLRSQSVVGMDHEASERLHAKFNELQESIKDSQGLR